jgi:hypothetical protein
MQHVLTLLDMIGVVEFNFEKGLFVLMIAIDWVSICDFNIVHILFVSTFEFLVQ